MFSSRFQLELKDDFMRRTEKLVENENKNKGQYLNYCIIKDKLVDVLHHVFYFSVETARIQKESAAIDAKQREHSRACSELKRLQVQQTTQPQSCTRVNFSHFK